MNRKPDYLVHREKKTAADTVVLADLLTKQAGRGLNARGFTSIQGFVTFTAGVAPTVTLQPCELVKWVDMLGTAHEKLVNRGAAIGPLSEDDAFEVPTPGGGVWVLRIHAITGAPTDVSVYVAAGDPAHDWSM